MSEDSIASHAFGHLALREIKIRKRLIDPTRPHEWRWFEEGEVTPDKLETALNGLPGTEKGRG